MEPLRIGLSKIDITPPVGFPQGGYTERLSPATGIHDPIFVHVMALEQGDQRCALVLTDLFIFSIAECEDIVNLASKCTPLLPEQILIHAMHNHAAPDTIASWDQDGNLINLWASMMMALDQQQSASEILSKIFLPGFQDQWQMWLENLKTQIASAIYLAWQDLQESSLSIASGIENGLTFNRREFDDPPETVDHQFTCLFIHSGNDQSIRGMFFNWGTHAVVLGSDNTEISADWPGAFRDAIQEKYGKDLWIGVAVAPAGNLNPRGIPFDDNSIRTFDDLNQFGQDLADQVFPSFNNAMPLIPSLKLLTQSVMISLENEDLVDSPMTKFIPFQQIDGKWVVQARISQVRLCEDPFTILFTIPGELFSRIGIELKENANAPYAMVMQLTHGHFGYLPTPQAFEKGGYEALLAPGPNSGMNLKVAHLDLLKKMNEENFY